MLGKDLIQNPQQWQLVIEVTASSLAVVAFSSYEEDALIAHNIPLSGSAPSARKALEDAVYDNPLLLSDFRRVIILYDTPRFLPFPPSGGNTDITAALFRRVFPPDPLSAGEIMHTPVPSVHADIVFEIPQDAAGFLRRTFHNATIAHPLAPVAAYFQAKHPARRHGKTLVNIQNGRVDIITLGENAPLTLASHRIVEPMDAVYYILSARSANALRDTDEIMISGDRTLRAAITPVLRKYVRYVMPAIFPSVMFRAGKASLGAPFEMILAPLTL